MEKYSISRKECRMRENAAYLVPETLKVEECRLAFYRTAQGRLPRPMSSKGKTTFFLKSIEGQAAFSLK